MWQKCELYPLYTFFCIKNEKFFYFFSKPVTKDTNQIIIVYQHLFAQICILAQDTKRYKKNKQAIPTLIRSNLYLGTKKLAIPTK